jgi:dienelactone hydrolase
VTLFRTFVLSAAAATLFAQVPAADRRNTETPNTDTPVKMPEYGTRAEWEARKDHLRKQILSAAGLYPLPEKTPLKPLIFGRIENGDYSIEKVALETMPGYWLAGNLFRPIGKPGKHPAVASPHGHWTYGRLEHQPLATVPGRAISLARQGYVVFTYDMVGYTDTTQTPHVFGDEREQLWSFGPLGLQLWNSIRVVDFLESLPEVDTAQIAATGASGGGTQTFLLTAVDDRVRVSAPVNMISSIMQGGSPCENAPGLRVGTSNLEFGAMMAPRPMLMVSATGDWTRNTPAVEHPALRRIWELYDAADKLQTIQIDAPHNYNKDSREAVYRFFGKHVLGRPDAASIAEKNIRVEKLGDMMVWHARALPAGALDFNGVRELWIRRSRAQADRITDRALIKERLQLALATEWPRNVVSERSGDRLVLSRAGRGDRVPAAVIGSGTPARVVVHPDGIDAARKHPSVQKWTAAGETLLLIDAFQTGSAVAKRDRSHRHFLTFNRTDDAERVQDILTALAWLRQNGATQLKLSGLDRAAVWSTFAAAVAPEQIELTERATFDGSDEQLIKQFFVPGIQRAGGWAAATKLAGR